MSRSSANVLLLLAGAMWGMGFVAQATAMQDIGPFLFVALRFTVACIVVAPFAWLESRREQQRDRPPLSSSELRRFALIGVVLFAGMGTQQVGLLTTSVTHSGFLTGLYVVFTPLVAVALYRDWPHRVVWPASALALLGIALLSGVAPGGAVVGDLLTIGSAIFWALQVVLIGRFVGSSGRPLVLSFTQFAVTAFLAWLVALIFEPFVLANIRAALPSVLYAGIFASGIAFTLQVIGQRYTSAPQAAIFLSSEAPFAALFGYLFMAEQIARIGLVGCALILCAMLLVELYPQFTHYRRSRLAAKEP